jgi:hypothetical protein
MEFTTPQLFHQKRKIIILKVSFPNDGMIYVIQHLNIVGMVSELQGRTALISLIVLQVSSIANVIIFKPS